MLSLGAPAEYGNLQGAVFNVVTRQGSNTFHGDANFYFQTQDLTGAQHRPRTRTAACPTTATSTSDSTVQLERADHQGQALVLRLVPVPARLPVAGRRPRRVPRASRGRPRLRQAQLADQRQEQADVRVPRRLLRRIPGDADRVDAPSAVTVETRAQPVAQRHLHRRCSPTRPTSRRATPASTARTTATR